MSSDAVETFEEHLRGYLEEKLPTYMIPSAFAFLPEMPLTPNGKIDRRALAQLNAGAVVTEKSFVAPRNETEARVAAIWAEVLDLPQVGIYSDFFKVGGHSLRAARVISRLRTTFGVELPLRSLFEASTIAALGEKIDAALGGPAPLASSSITRVTREQNDLPLSFAQQRLWFLDQLEPGNPFYNIPIVVYMSGVLDTAALERAINEIMRRHEVLRSTFTTIDGRPAQNAARTLQLRIPIIKLLNLSDDEKESGVRRFIKEEATRPFDLATGPLLRATLLKTAEREHVLLLTMHHIVSDGWSMGVLMREVGLLYVSYANGHPSPLPELPIQYADFADWQQHWMQGEVLQKQLAYWKQQLAGAPTVLELPHDRPRPPVQTYRGAYLKVELPSGLTQELNTLSRREGVTLFMLLLAAFVTLLNRYTDQDDILVGTPIANRNRSEIENLIGLFANTLVLRARLSPEMSFLELMKQMREVTLGAYAHQDIPFEKLVDEFQLEREMSRSPLFQVMFALQNAPLGKVELPGLSLKLAAGDSGTSKFDLTLFLEESAGGLVGMWEYSTDLFDESTIRRMATHFQTLLEGVVSDPRRRLFDLPLLPESERQQLLREFNDTAAEFPQDVRVHELFEQQVARTPEQVAVVSEQERVSYRELNERAGALAQRLRSLGVGPEARVGILLERSVEMVVALLGVLKAGGAYVPLDPQYPSERLRFMLADAQVVVLLTSERLSHLLPTYDVQLICLDQDSAPVSTAQPRTAVVAENLAYVIYTSGSTGTPKGVAITHRSASTMLHWAREVFSPEQLRGVLASTSICFDLSVFEIFLPLSVGGKVILARNALELPQLAAKDEVSLINTVPSAMAELIRSGGVPETVQTVNLAGEALKSELVRQIYEQSGAQQVWNLYGPSEDTTYSTYALIDKDNNGRVPIGRPVACSQVYLLDQRLQLVPVGITAELYLGGEGLARGYLGRPELTAEKFIPDPFGTKPGGRLYRTGDLARYLPDGNIEYLGRVDHQVKI
ncbi:MAG TPA: amino acid adenylation domain-containing protein, partial [Pyrinomonadaceae bacterium]